MLKNLVDACREQTSEGGTITKKEAEESVINLMTHALKLFDSEGRQKAFAVVEAALDFLDYYGGRPSHG